jgi:PAS domain S-box-containing protein
MTNRLTLDALIALVRRFGALPVAGAVTVACTLASAAIAAATMTWFGYGMIPALPLAVATPLVLAFPVCLLVFRMVARLDDVRRRSRDNESRLAAAEAHLRDAIENFPGAFALFDADDRLVLENSRYRKMFEAMDDLVVPGTPFATLARASVDRGIVIPDGTPDQYVARRLDQRRAPGLPVEQQLSDGRWVLVHDQRTAAGGFVSVRTDITPLRNALEAARESEERFAKAFQAAPVMTAIVDANTQRFVDVNDTFLRVLRYTRENAIGRTAFDLGMWVEPAARQRLMETLNRSGSVRGYAAALRRSDGGTLDCLLGADTIDLDGRPYYLFSAEDVTERNRIDRMKSEFIATVSHELRTPLTSVRGVLGLLEGGVIGAMSEQAQHLVSVARNNCDRLVRLVNDVLDLERIESGKLVLRNRQLLMADVVAEATIANAAYGEQYGVAFRVARADPGATVYADRDKVDQILANLLSNAARFSPRDAAVDISVERRDGLVRTAVADRGPGIPEAFRDMMFERFAQADPSGSHAQGGTGLGLSIVKGLVEQMNGTVGCTDAPGGGTIVYFDLPPGGTPDGGTPD